MFELRSYQQYGKDEIRKAFSLGSKRVIYCSPTGSGKTVTFASIAFDVLCKGKKIMILCDRRELITQAKNKLNEYGIFPHVIMAGIQPTESNCYLASVDTLKRRQIPEIDLIIIDEAHKSTFNKIIDQYNGFILGVTATPVNRETNKYYTALINPVQISELITNGYLSPAVTYSAQQNLDDIKKKGQDYDEKDISRHFRANGLYDGAVDNYIKFANNSKAICFCVSVEDSIEMRDKFIAKGIQAVHIDGGMSESERKINLQLWRSGIAKVLCNCSLYTTGFDEPDLMTVIINRCTMSLALWLQMCGRGSRIYQGKLYFTIIDMGSNVFKHGLWEQDRDFPLMIPIKKKGEQPAPVKNCPQCEAILHASAMECQYCKVLIPRKEKELLQGELTKVEAKESQYIPAHLRKPWASMTNDELEEYRKLKGWKKGWVHYQKMRRESI
jgi:superfamily II DNA or RNA helicase